MVTQGSHKGLVGRSRWKTSIFGTVILLAVQRGGRKACFR